MDNDWLKKIGVSFGNIAASIERQPAQEDRKAQLAQFNECLGAEVSRLRVAGQDRLANALQTGWHPLERLVSEGW